MDTTDLTIIGVSGIAAIAVSLGGLAIVTLNEVYELKRARSARRIAEAWAKRETTFKIVSRTRTGGITRESRRVWPDGSVSTENSVTTLVMPDHETAARERPAEETPPDIREMLEKMGMAHVQ